MFSRNNLKKGSQGSQGSQTMACILPKRWLVYVAGRDDWVLWYPAELWRAMTNEERAGVILRQAVRMKRVASNGK